ncbi:hypothetical protein TNIN_106041 [Trichonephila inaurata madagascariensis]|uniref:Uncharacterized protein n=1 Tax=Trichonephila inaurata madagascariensis TaxID=2747483 RepID=A0A8X6YP68_9ARAC|nr:hypothetical protein TNIN_106041 [Trichonephila inaurata madagascariensis]
MGKLSISRVKPGRALSESEIDIVGLFQVKSKKEREIEACLNFRPLAPVSSDPEDYTADTTAHFLIRPSLKGILEPNVCNERLLLCDRWKLRMTQCGKWLRHFGRCGNQTI